jgi:hypothetical protein
MMLTSKNQTLAPGASLLVPQAVPPGNAAAKPAVRKNAGNK